MLLDAVELSIPDIIAKDNQFREEFRNQFEFSLDVVPTFSEFVSFCKHTKKFKGLSEDLIGSEIFVLAPHEMARIFHPIATKSAVLAQYPLQ